MKKWIKRFVLGLLTVLIAAGLVYHLGLRNWCMRWGTTIAEAHATLPGDELFSRLHRPGYTRDHYSRDA